MAQTPDEADIRGNDYSADEHDRAVAHRTNQLRLGMNRARLLGKLRGSTSRLRDLEHKTLPLARSSPPYHDFP